MRHVLLAALAALAVAFHNGFAQDLTAPMFMPATDGQASLTVAPDGRVAELVYVTKIENGSTINSLAYRERLPGQPPGDWETVTSGAVSESAFVWFGSDNQPRVIHDATETDIAPITFNIIYKPRFREMERSNNMWVATGRSWAPTRGGRTIFVKRGNDIGLVKMDSNGIGYTRLLDVMPAEEVIDDDFASQTKLEGFDVPLPVFGFKENPRNLSAAFDASGRLPRCLFQKPDRRADHWRNDSTFIALLRTA